MTAGFDRAQFALLDAARQARGGVLSALGLGEVECGHRVIASGPCWRLRDYGGEAEGAPLMIVAAPIKRPYIWDLSPSVSVIRLLLDHGLRVRLLEWTSPASLAAPTGLDDYVGAIGTCLRQSPRGARGAGPILLGHSLGGTLAAIAAAFDPDGAAGLVLLGAPLCFREGTTQFRDRVAALAAFAPADTELVPGSVLTYASALVSPGVFVWSRMIDAATSLDDLEAIALHLRVARWAFDEAPLPGRLVNEILQWLYREDRLCKGTLPVRGRAVGARDLVAPTLAVVDAADELAPRATVTPFLEKAPADSRVLEYPGEPGVALQHLALLVGRRARAQLWPQIVAWLRACREPSAH